MIRRCFGYEWIRYLGSGAICALVNNAVLIISDKAGIDYFGLLALSWGITGSIGYALRARLTWMGYSRFLAGVALGIPMTLACLVLFKSFLHLPMWQAAPATTVVMLFFNYISARLAILRAVVPRGVEPV
jgi:putative flippase GtrA